MKSVRYFAWVLLFAFASSSAFSAAPQAKPTSEVAALKGLKATVDKMEGITWYKHPSTPDGGNAFYLYFGRTKEGRVLPLRLNVRYWSDSWLFVSDAWAMADGVRTSVPQEARGRLGWERDHSSGTIWEWSDTSLTAAADLEAVRKIANSKDVTIRFVGSKYHDDKKVSAKQLAALRAVLLAHQQASTK